MEATYKAKVNNGKATRTGTMQTTTNSSKEAKVTMAHTSADLSTLIVIKHATRDSDQSTTARCEVDAAPEVSFVLYFVLLDTRYIQLDPHIFYQASALVGMQGIFTSLVTGHHTGKEDL